MRRFISLMILSLMGAALAQSGPLEGIRVEVHRDRLELVNTGQWPVAGPIQLNISGRYGPGGWTPVAGTSVEMLPPGTETRIPLAGPEYRYYRVELTNAQARRVVEGPGRSMHDTWASSNHDRDYREHEHEREWEREHEHDHERAYQPGQPLFSGGSIEPQHPLRHREAMTITVQAAPGAYVVAQMGGKQLQLNPVSPGVYQATYIVAREDNGTFPVMVTVNSQGAVDTRQIGTVTLVGEY